MKNKKKKEKGYMNSGKGKSEIIWEQASHLSSRITTFSLLLASQILLETIVFLSVFIDFIALLCINMAFLWLVVKTGKMACLVTIFILNNEYCMSFLKIPFQISPVPGSEISKSLGSGFLMNQNNVFKKIYIKKQM